MKSLAVIRATDVLKLRSTISKISEAGINFEGSPKEINPVSLEKMLSKTSEKSDRPYEVCALVPLALDYESSMSRIKGLSLYSDVLMLDSSHELFDRFARLIPVLPDIDLPGIYKNTGKRVTDVKAKPSEVYLGVFVNRKVKMQTSSGTLYDGVLKHADSIGVFFEPLDGSSPFFITWHDIKKIIIPKEEK
jgi:hypothetical protein